MAHQHTTTAQKHQQNMNSYHLIMEQPLHSLQGPWLILIWEYQPPDTHKPPSALIPYDVDLRHPQTPSAAENAFNGNAEVHVRD